MAHTPDAPGGVVTDRAHDPFSRCSVITSYMTPVMLPVLCHGVCVAMPQMSSARSSLPVLALAAVLVLPCGPAVAGPSLQGSRADVIRLVNEARDAAGCLRVRQNKAVTNSSQEHTADMAKARRLSHRGRGHRTLGARLTARGYPWTYAGENIARGAWDASTVVRVWLRSPEHRARIVDCRFQDAGVGIMDGVGGPWWTLDLAAHR